MQVAQRPVSASAKKGSISVPIMGPTTSPISSSLIYLKHLPFHNLCFLLLAETNSLLPSMPENQKQEVIWPRLVANKLFRRPLSSHSFVADFPSTEMLLDVTNLDGPEMSKRSSNDQKDRRKYKLFASTWNVGGVSPPNDLNLEDWLDTKHNSYDIYVLGFQEIVPLSAKNVLGRETSSISMKWNSLIRATLNKSLSNSHTAQESKAGEKQKVHPFKEGTSRKQFAHDFQCVVSKQMVGILVSVWVRGDLRRYIRRPSVSCVGCGIMGCLGNKGSVSVRFWLQETSFCFVCCHLASGAKQEDEMHRNSNAMEILSRTIFPSGPSSHDLPQKILDHDRIILLGDLNYRISLPESMTCLLVEQKEWNILLQNDQLHGEVSSDGGVFEGWHEGAITFAPTYKYQTNSDTYYVFIQGKKGKKRRAPAWCDRILWYGEGLKQDLYDRFESRLSDHRPVRALFTVEVEVPRDLNSLRSFFLSDRFDRIISDTELFLKDDQMRSARFSATI
ncbi:type IV inositol polyphosphate 5-phosphatase 9 [Typha angustifolia]|uniref:type IV inositol polyphosphate 5-phosphatase 9 n=1 Tax=Typha angustifolia TaxID=59011 RepID=UPI003C2B7579